MCPLLCKVELEVVLKKMDSDRAKYEQKLEQQAQLLDTRAAKINKLEGIYSSGLILQLIPMFLLLRVTCLHQLMSVL